LSNARCLALLLNGFGVPSFDEVGSSHPESLFSENHVKLGMGNAVVSGKEWLTNYGRSFQHLRIHGNASHRHF
jgi:hypothetical protein